jgi:hypothetical protein
MGPAQPAALPPRIGCFAICRVRALPGRRVEGGPAQLQNVPDLVRWRGRFMVNLISPNNNPKRRLLPPLLHAAADGLAVAACVRPARHLRRTLRRRGDRPRPRPLRAVAHRQPPRRRRPHRALQLPPGALQEGTLRAPRRGHRPRPLHEAVRGGRTR